MALGTLTQDTLDVAVRAVVNELHVRDKQLSCWRDLLEDELWYELAACILGSAVSYDQAWSCVELLRTENLLRPPHACSSLDSFEQNIAKALSGRYRFPFVRAKQLRRTAEAIYGRSLSLSQLLGSEKDPHRLRARLVRIGTGVGPKQASLFLRNVGYADFAVLDRHVVRFMLIRGLICSKPELQTLPGYEEVERVFVNYADHIAIPVVDLDLAVWIVIRATRRELLA